MRTKLLYYDDIYAIEFNANIIEITEENNQYYIILDQTAFYPNSGGMNADKGYIDEIEVIDVLKKGDDIIHVLSEKPKNTKINGTIDYKTRIKHIQFHDAQHLLTAILEKEYDLKTISHHVHDNYCDLILDGPTFNQEIIDEIEKKANEMIFDHVPMEIFYLKKSELNKYNIIDNPKYSDPVRITNIVGLDDYNACGCLHFDNLSKIQAIKCISFEKSKNQFKFYFTAGFEMIEYFDIQNNIIKELKLLAKANEDNIISKINAVYEKNNTLTKELSDLKSEMYHLLLPTLINDDLIIYQDPNNDMTNLKAIAQEIINYDKPLLGLLQIKKEDKYQFILVKQKENNYSLEDLFNKLKNDFPVTGGGKGLSINGQSDVDLTEIFNQYK